MAIRASPPRGPSLAREDLLYDAKHLSWFGWWMMGLAAACSPHPRSPSAPPARLTWQRLPDQQYLCTRHGPDWTLDPATGKAGYQGTFVLEVPPGMDLRLSLEARATDHRRVRYRMRGAPAGARLDAASGRFGWRVEGRPRQHWEVTFTASASGAGPISWTLDLRIASLARSLAWRAGLGDAKPSCEYPRTTVRQIIAEDLDGDGQTDVLWVTWISDGGGDGVYRSGLCLGSRGGFRCLHENDAEGTSVPGGPVDVFTTADGIKLLRFSVGYGMKVHDVYYRVEGGQLEKKLDLEADLRSGPGGDSIEPIVPRRDARGRLVAVEERRAGKDVNLHVWRKGAFVMDEKKEGAEE